jgi:hypothetical protein
MRRDATPMAFAVCPQPCARILRQGPRFERADSFRMLVSSAPQCNAAVMSFELLNYPANKTRFFVLFRQYGS